MKIAVGMSGGVDSAVAAALLKAQGHEVVGFTMKLFDGTYTKCGCFSNERAVDIEDCEKICKIIGIEHHVIDMSKRFKQVINYVIDDYLTGDTPNPCIVCNKYIKFGEFFVTARAKFNFDKFATGHYATINEVEGRHLLYYGNEKDQTYFLAALTEDVLKDIIFPLDGYKKSEVRKIALELGLPVAEKKDSQDFAGGNYAQILPADKKGKKGAILLNDIVVGEHSGLENYTIGQRRGLNARLPVPVFVVKKRLSENILEVSTKNVPCYGVTSKIFNYELLKADIPVYAKYRSSMEPIPMRLCGTVNNEMLLAFREPQFGVATGQFVVMYQAGYIVGWAAIDDVIDFEFEKF